MKVEEKTRVLNENIGELATLLWRYKASSSVESVSVSDDGSYIAAGDWDTVYFFSREGALLWSYKTGSGVSGVSVSIDASGSYVAVGSGEDDKKVLFFNREGELLWSYDTGDDVLEVTVSFTGSYVAAAAGKKLYFFNQEGELLWSYKKKGLFGGSIGHVSLSSDGSYIAAGDSSRKVLFFNREGELLWSKKTKVGGHLRTIEGISVSSDGSYVAAVSGGWSLPENKGDISFFDDDGELLWNHELEFCVESVAVSATGFHIAVGGEPLLFLERGGEFLWRHDGGAGVYGDGVAISSDGSYVATCPDSKVSFFNRKGELLWSYKIGRAGESPIKGVAMSPDGSYVAAVGGRNLCFFNFKSKAPKPEVESGIKRTVIKRETVREEIPVIISKVLPSKCPDCGSPFKGKSGDVCEYCGTVIRAEDKVKKVE